MITTLEPTSEITTTTEIPYGYCQCGCGAKTRIAAFTDRQHGWTKGEPIRFIAGHHQRLWAAEATRRKELARHVQLEIDMAIDDERRDRLNWQRAIDDDLHAIQDYVGHETSYRLIVWEPGLRGYCDLVTPTSCTCSRFKLWDRCQHTAFAQKLAAADMLPGLEAPVSVREVD